MFQVLALTAFVVASIVGLTIACTLAVLNHEDRRRQRKRQPWEKFYER